MKRTVHQIRSVAADQSGQSSVWVALTAVVFIAFLVFLADIGRVIHDKIETQGIADVAALAAANIQAIGMNEIADLNAEIDLLHQDFLSDLMDADFQYAPTEGYHNYFYYFFQLEYLKKLQDEAVEEFPVMASAAARAIVDMHNDMYDKRYRTISDGTHQGVRAIEKWKLEEVMGPDVPQSRLIGLQRTGVTVYGWLEYYCFSYYCSSTDVSRFTGERGGIEDITVPYSVTIPGMGILDNPRRLDPDTRAYYRLRLKRPPIRPLIDMEKYGFDVVIPEMVVYSQAQPHKGNIEELAPDYEARLAPLWKEYPEGSRTDDIEFLKFFKEFKH